MERSFLYADGVFNLILFSFYVGLMLCWIITTKIIYFDFSLIALEALANHTLDDLHYKLQSISYIHCTL